MAKSSHQEHRRHGARPSREDRTCAACGGRAIRRGEIPFCADCLAWSRQASLAEWDDLGAGD